MRWCYLVFRFEVLVLELPLARWSFCFVFRLETPNNEDEIQHRACFLHVFSNCLSSLFHTLLILIFVVDTDEEREYTSGRCMNDELMIIGLLLSSEIFNASIYLLVRLSCLILFAINWGNPPFSMLLYFSYVYKYLIVFDTCVVLQRQLIAPICSLYTYIGVNFWMTFWLKRKTWVATFFWEQEASSPVAKLVSCEFEWERDAIQSNI